MHSYLDCFQNGRVAGIDAFFQQALFYHGTCSDNDVVSDADTLNKDGPASDETTVSYPATPIYDRASRNMALVSDDGIVFDVGERIQNDIVADPGTRVYEGVVHNHCSFSQIGMPGYVGR